jgi:hypothetical protein
VFGHRNNFFKFSFSSLASVTFVRKTSTSFVQKNLRGALDENTKEGGGGILSIFSAGKFLPECTDIR